MTELAEAPAVERDGAITRIPHWIGGTRVDGTSGRTGPVYNPATGVQRGAVDLASAEEVDAAVRNANEAFRAWRGTSIAKRAELFFAIRELFHARREDIAKTLTAEHGKVLSDGFRMKQLPHAIAGAHIHMGTIAGKLNGVMPATTPTGWRIE